MNRELKTSNEAEEYFNKLKETMGNKYNLNYYLIETDKNLSDFSFDTHNEIEKIIRIIAISDKDKFKKKDLKFGAITIDVSNVLDKDGKQLYKNYLETLEQIEGDLNNELCNI